MGGYPKSEALGFYVIYDHPTDYPEHFVVRVHWIVSGRVEPITEAICHTFVTLDEARQFAGQDGRVKINRHENDDSKIVETWI
jgi:hypothetical protein